MKTLIPALFLAVALAACSADTGYETKQDPADANSASNRRHTISPTPAVSAEQNTATTEPVERTPFIGTLSKTELKLYDADPSTLVAVRAAAHDGYDRVVFEFKEQLPGYLVEYADGSMQSCGSGDDVTLAGKAKLRVRFTPATAHTNDGTPTVPFNELKTDIAQIIELKRTCDFEAEVEWAVGLTEKKPYRLTELRDPSRVVIDVKH